MEIKPISLNSIQDILNEDVYQFPLMAVVPEEEDMYGIYNLNKSNVKEVAKFVESSGGLVAKQIKFTDHKGQQKFTIWYKPSDKKEL